MEKFSFVMRGLDPRIHADWSRQRTLRQDASVFAAWIAGLSPAMTSGELQFDPIGTGSN